MQQRDNRAMFNYMWYNITQYNMQYLFYITSGNGTKQKINEWS